MTTNAKILQMSRSFGKHDGEEVFSTELFHSMEELKKLLEDEGFDEEDIQELFEKHKAIYIDNDGGDWDDPTGFYIEVFTKEEKIQQITEKYKKELNKIEALFK